MLDSLFSSSVCVRGTTNDRIPPLVSTTSCKAKMGNATSLSTEGVRGTQPESAAGDGGVRIADSIDTSDTSSLTLQDDIDDAGSPKDKETMRSPTGGPAQHVETNHADVVPSYDEDDEEQGVMLPRWKVFNAYDRKAMQLASPRRANDNALSSGGRHRGIKKTPAEVLRDDSHQTLRIADLEIPEEKELVEFMADVEAFVADAAEHEKEGWPGYQSRMSLHLDVAEEWRLAARSRGKTTRAASRVRSGRVLKKERRNPHERVNEHGHTVHRAH